MPTKPSLKPQDLSYPTILVNEDLTNNFTCGHKEIDDFIQKEALIFQEQLLGVHMFSNIAMKLLASRPFVWGTLTKRKWLQKIDFPNILEVILLF